MVAKCDVERAAGAALRRCLNPLQDDQSWELIFFPRAINSFYSEGVRTEMLLKAINSFCRVRTVFFRNYYVARDSGFLGHRNVSDYHHVLKTLKFGHAPPVPPCTRMGAAVRH